MDAKQPHRGWLVNLSDGALIMETPNIDGERTSWQKLLQVLRDTPTLKITGLRIQHHGITLTSVSHKEVDGFFQGRETWQSWADTRKGELGNRQWQGIGVVVGDTIFCTWIDLDSAEIRQSLRQLDADRIHTTLYDAKNTGDDSRPSASGTS